MEVELAEQLARASERQGEDLMEEDPNQALVLEQSEVLKDASEAASAAQRCIPLFACFHRLLQQPHDDPHLGIDAILSRVPYAVKRWACFALLSWHD